MSEAIAGTRPVDVPPPESRMRRLLKVGAAIVATVVRVTPGDTQTVVDVLVSQDRSAELAARAATGKLAVVLDSRER